MATTTDKRKALGRGLDALLPGKPAASATVQQRPAAPSGAAIEIQVELIDHNPFQTRSHVDELAMKELTESVRVSGVLQPVLLRPIPGGRFQLMAGQRRLQAARAVGKHSVPAVVKPASDQQAMEITIIENLQREDLGAMEQARAFVRLSSEFGLTQEQIAQRTGKERGTVANFMRLVRLPDEVQKQVESGDLTFGHARALLALPEEELLIKTAGRVVEKALSVRQTEELVRAILAPSEPKPKEAKPIDPNVRQAEIDLQSSLGCKVEVHDRKGKGKIVIHYASLEDFDRVVERVNR